MKITNINTYTLRMPIDKPFYASCAHITTRYTLLVKVETDQGIVGWGECYGHYPEVTSVIIDKLWKPILVGKDPLDNEVLWDLQYRGIRGQKGPLLAAMSGIDIALWDIKGKVTGLPIAKLMGGMFRDSIKVYATGCYFTETNDLPKALAEEAQVYVNQGFSAVKMKIGLGADIDVSIVSAVRHAMDDSIGLMVDANCAYDARTAIMLGRKLEDLNVYWFEEPVEPNNIEGYIEVKNALDMYIAGGELEFTKFGFKDFISRRAADIVQPDIAFCGGLTEGKKIAALCETWGVRCLPHYCQTGIGFAASLHLTATLPAIYSVNDPMEPILEFDRTPSPIRDNVLMNPFNQKNSRITVPTDPGLGIEVNEEFIVKNSIKV